MFGETATARWRKEYFRRAIVTSCRELDVALSGGIPTGVITEFCGPPGSGKTQMCLQLCVNVQVPNEFDNGVDGEAVFIDTNCGYNPYRFRTIATAKSIELCGTNSKRQMLLVDKFMDGVRLYFLSDLSELMAVIHNLWELLTANSKIRLIVIDSFSFLFRQVKSEDKDVFLTALLYQTIGDLQKLADNFHCALVLTNELSMRPNASDEMLVPSLGDSHVHRIGQLITLGKNDVKSDVFCANIDKSLLSPEVVVKFRIAMGGIQSVN